MSTAEAPVRLTPAEMLIHFNVEKTADREAAEHGGYINTTLGRQPITQLHRTVGGVEEADKFVLWEEFRVTADASLIRRDVHIITKHGLAADAQPGDFNG